MNSEEIRGGKVKEVSGNDGGGIKGKLEKKQGGLVGELREHQQGERSGNEGK